MAPEGKLAAKPVCIRSMHCDRAYRLGSSLQGIMEACPKAQARASRGEPAASPTGAACLAGQHQQLAGNSRVWCMLTGRARHAAPAEPATSRQDGGDEFQSVQRPLGGGAHASQQACCPAAPVKEGPQGLGAGASCRKVGAVLPVYSQIMRRSTARSRGMQANVMPRPASSPPTSCKPPRHSSRCDKACLAEEPPRAHGQQPCPQHTLHTCPKKDTSSVYSNVPARPAVTQQQLALQLARAMLPARRMQLSKGKPRTSCQPHLQVLSAARGTQAPSHHSLQRGEIGACLHGPTQAFLNLLQSFKAKALPEWLHSCCSP